MGKYRFKFSNMIPNAWFYKLKDISSKTRTTTQFYNRKQQQQQQQQQPPPPPHISLPRYSYNYNSDGKFHNSPVNHKASDTHFPPDPSIKSSRKRKTVYKPSPRHLQSPEYYCYISSPKSCSLDLEFPESSDFEEEEKFVAAAAAEYGDSCKCEVISSTTDVIIDLNSDDNCKKHQIDGLNFDEISEMDLPPILTKPQTKFLKEKEQKSRKNGSGIRLRTNSPRIASKKIQERKSISSSKSTSTSKSKSRSMISESFVVVKTSIDPEKDFRDSMVEMIEKNNLTTAKDLEHLLACYLSLNSNVYHHLIVKAFEQVWFHMTTNLTM